MLQGDSVRRAEQMTTLADFKDVIRRAEVIWVVAINSIAPVHSTLLCILERVDSAFQSVDHSIVALLRAEQVASLGALPVALHLSRR
jgi:hypothetical protein